jgi:hypothetical protein
VARVFVSNRPDDAVVNFARELDVARHLAREARPSAAPLQSHDVVLTLMLEWGSPCGRTSSMPSHGCGRRYRGERVATVHEMLIEYAGELSAFTDAIEGCRVLLQERPSLPALLPKRSRVLLDQSTSDYERLLRMIAGDIATVPIHGDAHLGNVLMASGRALWTDFESTCRGPLKWKLSCLPEESLVSFPSVDRNRLAALWDLRSLCVAVWCSNDIDPDQTSLRQRGCSASARADTGCVDHRASCSAGIAPLV